ncbi:ribbon-helix-helix protein, CopG family [Mesorhizobium sp. 131-3-5]|uniref:ribbon-helix-helix protein, CopG family n=1 Tax=Mesorhizobium sp. 131-3-5 TaxID=2744520 RepID=UPI00313EC117
MPTALRSTTHRAMVTAGSGKQIAMSRQSFVQELEGAADRNAEMSPSNLKVLLRRAALMLRNAGDGVDLEPKIEEILDGLAAEMGVSKAELIRTVVTEWLIANAYLPVFTIDEGSTTVGNG